MPKKEQKQLKQRKVLVALIAFVGVLAALAVSYWLYQRSTEHMILQGLEPLENALKQHGFRLYKPPREGSWGVATVVRFVDGEPSKVMCAEDVLGKYVVPDTNRVGFANYTLRGKFASQGLAFVPKLAKANIAYGNKLTTTIEFRGVALHTVPLIELQRRLNEIEELRRHLKGRSNLFVVTEALRVEGLEYNFGVDQEGSGGLGTSAAKDLQAAMQGDFKVTASGNLATTFPLFLGYKVQRLETVASALGGASRIQITELTSDQFERVIGLQPFHSDFQVFALGIGLGNYSRYSPRVGGKLIGYKASVEVVANRLKQLHGSKGPAYVEVHTSSLEELAEGTGKLISRQRFMDTIDRFTEVVKRQMVPDSNNLVVFYYFGHGISEPLSRMALLVPEDFADLPEKQIHEVWHNLILLHEVVGKLEQLPGRVLILIDACRTREHEREIHPEMSLGPVLPPGVGPLLVGLDLLPMFNYFYGPNPVIFCSKDRQQALVVPYVMSDGYIATIGPLAKRFDQLWRKTIAHEEVLTLKQLVNGLITSDENGGPVGYGAWRGKVNLTEDAFVNPRK